MDFGTKDIGIDLGTSTTLIYVNDKGLALKEPTVVAINMLNEEVLAVGSDAKEMLGRTPSNILAVKPMKNGVIANFSAAKLMFQEFFKKVCGKSFFSKPRLVIGVPAGITEVEYRALEEAAYFAGAKEVLLVESAIVSAIGAGLNVDKSEGSMIVDIGGGITEVAVIALGKVVTSGILRIAGDDMDEHIIEYIKEKYGVIIGRNAAEEIKNTIGAASTSVGEDRVTVKGRNLSTGLPDTVTVTSNDIRDALNYPLAEIIKIINTTLEKTPPELASDIMEKGITLCGGGAYIKNLDRHINNKVGIPVVIAEHPLECAIKGIGKIINNPTILKKSKKNNKR